MSEIIDFPVSGRTCKGHLSLPNLEQGPGIIVLQEWWGINEHIKSILDRFADEGFVALAPDLYHGEIATKPDIAQRLMMSINIAEAEKDLKGAINYLLNLSNVTSDQIGVVGFCMGGQLALYAACQNEKIGACVDFYGIHPKVEPNLESLFCPLLGLFGAKDTSVPPQMVHALEDKLKHFGKNYDIQIYPETGHAFFNDSRPEAYHEASAENAWKRTVQFFTQCLSE